MKTLNLALFFLFIIALQSIHAQKQTIELKQHKLEVTKVSIDNSYNGMTPYNPNKNPDFDKILIVELTIISGDSDIKKGEGDIEIWLSDDLNNKITGADKTALSRGKKITYLFNINSTAKNFKLHFGKITTVNLELSSN